MKEGTEREDEGGPAKSMIQLDFSRRHTLDAATRLAAAGGHVPYALPPTLRAHGLDDLLSPASALSSLGTYSRTRLHVFGRLGESNQPNPACLTSSDHNRRSSP